MRLELCNSRCEEAEFIAELIPTAEKRRLGTRRYNTTLNGLQKVEIDKEPQTDSRVYPFKTRKY